MAEQVVVVGDLIPGAMIHIRYDTRNPYSGPSAARRVSLMGFFVTSTATHIFISPCWPMLERSKIWSIDLCYIDIIRVLKAEVPALKESVGVRETRRHTYIGDADRRLHDDPSKAGDGSGS